MGFAPTAEQTDAVTKAASGESLTIDALAGAGKTSTLRLIADTLAPKRGLYVAFNRAIRNDAVKSFPKNVDCKTMHQLAWKPIIQYRNSAYGKRLNDRSKRMPGTLASVFGIREILAADFNEETVTLDREQVARLAEQTVRKFCGTADREIVDRHVPRIPALDRPKEWSRNQQVAPKIVPFARAMWEDICDERKTEMQFEHDHYLKLWQLTNPHLGYDFILFDEAQDADPLMIAVIGAQTHAQLIFVGDQNQQIYSWRGAVNAMQNLDGQRSTLTKSFRFGPAVAEAANAILDHLPTDLRVEGAGSANTVRCSIEVPDAVLCRTNAAVVSKTLHYLEEEVADGDPRNGHYHPMRVHVVGGVDDLVWFARTANALQKSEKPRSPHPLLASFKTWAEVTELVEESPEDAADIAGLVKLCQQFGAARLVNRLLETEKTEANADIVISTAHKSKGREWDRVQLADGFGSPYEEKLEDGKIKEGCSEEELRLLYVAVTRAQLELDIDELHWLREDLGDAPKTVPGSALEDEEE